VPSRSSSPGISCLPALRHDLNYQVCCALGFFYYNQAISLLNDPSSPHSYDLDVPLEGIVSSMRRLFADSQSVHACPPRPSSPSIGFGEPRRPGVLSGIPQASLFLSHLLRAFSPWFPLHGDAARASGGGFSVATPPHYPAFLSSIDFSDASALSFRLHILD